MVSASFALRRQCRNCGSVRRCLIRSWVISASLLELEPGGASAAAEMVCVAEATPAMELRLGEANSAREIRPCAATSAVGLALGG